MRIRDGELREWIAQLAIGSSTPISWFLSLPLGELWQWGEAVNRAMEAMRGGTEFGEYKGA